MRSSRSSLATEDFKATRQADLFELQDSQSYTETLPQKQTSKFKTSLSYKTVSKQINKPSLADPLKVKQ